MCEVCEYEFHDYTFPNGVTTTHPGKAQGCTMCERIRRLDNDGRRAGSGDSSRSDDVRK